MKLHISDRQTGLPLCGKPATPAVMDATVTRQHAARTPDERLCKNCQKAAASIPQELPPVKIPSIYESFN